MAFNAFLKIDGIEGESTDSKHKDWIEVLALGWGVDNPQTGAFTAGGGGSSRASFHDLAITKATDKASPKLMLACASGQHLKQVVLEVCRTGKGKQPFLQYTLTDALVTSLRLSGDQGKARPLEDVGFTYAKIECKYTRLDSTGKPVETIDAGWDIQQNKKT
jgi:type VI secretion system secreted protein Hcp